MESNKICIVDDHKLVRDAIRAFFIGQTDIVIASEFGTGLELLRALPSIRADLFLLDLILPDLNGLQLIAPILEHHPQARVLILTAEMEEDLLCKAVEAGAHGFMHKDTSAAELLHAVRQVLEGEPWFGQNLSKLVYKSFCKKVKEAGGREVQLTITNREAEVIKLLGEGLSVKQIADYMFISPRTVETHKNNLLEKLELENTVALIKYGIRNKIISL